jgi:hypothetical protein
MPRRIENMPSLRNVAAASAVALLIQTPMLPYAPAVALEVATASEAEEMSPEEMETALAREQFQHDEAMTADVLLGSAFSKFDELYRMLLSSRGEAAFKAMQSIVAQDGCNLSAVDRAMAPDSFVRSDLLRSGKDELEKMRARSGGAWRTEDLKLPSEQPIDVTEDVEKVIAEASDAIAVINSSYGSLCLQAEQTMAALPATDAAKMMKAASELRMHDTEGSAEVEAIIIEMNAAIDETDAAVIAWLAEPLRRASASLPGR